MPELAEVEFFRQQWTPGLDAKVLAVQLHAGKRIFRGVDTSALEKALTGAKLVGSEGNGKQMLFHFSGGAWLGIHLGMSGELRAEKAGYEPKKHDHLVLQQKARALVFQDARMFGRVRFSLSKTAPDWWTQLPPALTSPSFTAAYLQTQLTRRARSPLKAVLLDQAVFPGVGNWMADEILWQAKRHPAAPSGKLTTAEVRAIWKTTRAICRTALRTIGVDWSDPPKDWLIHVRWKAGGKCPRDGHALDRKTIAGRTTAWCPQCQPKPKP